MNGSKILPIAILHANEAESKRLGYQNIALGHRSRNREDQIPVPDEAVAY